MPKLLTTPALVLKSTARVAAGPRLERLLDTRAEKHAAKKQLEMELAELDEKLLPELQRLGGKVESETCNGTLVESENRSISRDKLIQAGVRPSVIAKCTDVKPYSYVLVTVKK